MYCGPFHVNTKQSSWRTQHAILRVLNHRGRASYLLDEGAPRLSEGVADHVHGSLTLSLLLGVEVDVGHLLARVEQRVLAAFRQDVLDRLGFGCRKRGVDEREKRLD